ncbi:rod shape-determining protein RodA [Porphyromonas sp.]|uniref:rod shape-determining protein RodA n=1 Tax=Porphyromonas sp. TaxID=1924944 RepID=UPI0026DB5BE0|nr:rod shape-determining protein RodA [Porphyromonas sp.]MDO4695308.1 rod shape-determining protein RodA [Porphyromonas sp.]MDO4771029.1 rod shape-determining protein RodA [Porphyromonas sp.]
MNKVESTSFFRNIDYITVGLYLLIVLLGWITIYAAGYDIQNTGVFDLHGRTGSQLMWLGVSFVFIVLILVSESIFIKAITPWVYVGMLLLLIVTIFIAPDIKGSHSWLVITDTMRLQPAEFAKVSTALMLAQWCSRYEFSIANRQDLLISLLIFLLPMLIIILQNETGSAVVFATFFIVMYREGLTGSVIAYGVFIALLFILSLKFAGVMWQDTAADTLVVISLIYTASYLAVEMYGRLPLLRPISIGIPLTVFSTSFILSFFTPINYGYAAIISLCIYTSYMLLCLFLNRGKRLGIIVAFAVSSVAVFTGIEYFFSNVLQDHQQNRILVSLGIKDDPSGAGYNVNQSMIAIGSGGITGKGFLNGTQTKLKYVPEQDTDFIFCTVGEESGFIGSTFVLGLYLILLLRLVYLAERQSDPFARIYGYSVACILFFHLVINIGMVIGLVPVIGIPLPYFSYGGSSLLSFSILLFIFLRLDTCRKEK